MMVSSTLLAAVNHDASLRWQTLQSPHFTLHFHQGEERTARELLAIAESVHQRLAPLLEWQPLGGTEIVLSDEADRPNGWATPYPSDRLMLFLTPPDTIDGLEDHAGWLELVFTHEYLHILHLDKAAGTPAALRTLFGRHLLLFPNALQPAWFIEGLATHVETDTARGIGRGQSSYYAMLMRMEALAGLKPLRQVNQPLVSWPMGDVPYLYGVHFYQWLAEHYGAEQLAALVDNYSDNVVPFRIGSNAQQVVGKSLDALWSEFSAEMSRRAAAQQAAIVARGLSEGRRLGADGYFAGALVAGRPGEFYYAAFDAQRRPALMRLRGEKRERLAELTFGARLSFHPQQGLLVAQPEVCRNAALYYDLYRYDAEGGHRQRLTQCGRYRHAVWAPDGQSLIAVHNALGYSELHRLAPDGTLQQRLWRGEQREVVGELAWSPDGRQLAAALWLPGQGWELALFDLAGGRWQPLTHSVAIEGQPSFSADGRQLLFSADYDGVYNLYALDLQTRLISRLSNVTGGAFFPQLAEGELTYVGYSAAGFDLYRLPWQPRPEAVVVADGSGALAAAPLAPVAEGTPRDYSPLASVRPRWWFPHLYVDDGRSELGAMSGGSDTLQRHLYAVDLAYDARNQWGVGSVDYIYDRWTPIFKLHGDTTPQSELDDSGKLLKIRSESAAVVEVVTPLRRYYRQWAAHLGVVEQRSADAVLTTGAVAQAPLRDRVAGIALSFDSASTMPRAVSRADGRELLLVTEDSDLLRGSDYQGRATFVDWKEFIRLGGEHVLALRGVAARGDDGIRPFNLGGFTQVNYLPLLFDTRVANAPFNRRDFALRGYAEGLPQLTGTQMRMGSLEYRFPLWRLERGLMAPPLGLHQLHGAAFAESGTAWQKGGSPQRYYRSYGAELSADTVLFYSMMLRLSLGYARGVEAIGGEQYYLRLGAAF